MKKKRFRVISLALICVFVFMQLSGTITTLAESKTPLTVAEVGDSNLYAALATATDPYGNNGGILYKEDAESLSSLNFYNSSMYNSIRAVESFANLSAICPNLTSISGVSYVSETALPSFIDEYANLDKLTYIDLQNNYLTVDEFNQVCAKRNPDLIRSINLTLYKDFDLSQVSNFSNATSFDLTVNSNVSTIDLSGLDQLTNLNSFYLYYYNGNNSKVQNIIDALNSQIEYIYISNTYYYNSEGLDLNVSKFNNLINLTLNGYYNNISGLKDLTSLKYLYIDNYNSTDKYVIDVNELPQSLTQLQTTNCDFTTTDLGFLPDTINSVYISGSNISDISQLNNKTSLSNVSLENSELTTIPDLSNLRLSYLQLDDNQITDISNIKDMNVSYLYNLDLSNNQITDVSALSVLTKATSLYRLDLAFNNISELCDLSSCTNLVGRGQYVYNDDLFGEDYFRYSLLGNNLTESAIKDNVPDDCYNDQYFMYASTLKGTSNGKAYAEDIDEQAISYMLLDQSYATVYVSKKDFTLSSDLIDYIRSNEDNLTIYYVDENGNVAQELSINGANLSDDLTSLDVSFSALKYGTSNDAINQAFSKYGSIDFYYTTPGAANTSISGVTYYYNSIQALDSNKTYHIYHYNAEDATFSYYSTTRNTSYVYMNSYSEESSTYFYVDADQDTYMGTQYDENGGYVTYYYNIDDDTINSAISNYTMSLYTTADSIDLSADTVAALKASDRGLYIYKYNKEFNCYESQTYLNPSYLASGALHYDLPDITISDTNETIASAFSGGTPSRYYDVSALTSTVAGVTSYAYFNAGIYAYNKNLNLYTFSNGNYIPLTTNFYSSTRTINGDAQYFVIPTAEDSNFGIVNGVYYNKDVSAESLKSAISYCADEGVYYYSIRTVDSQIQLDAETVEMLKNKGITLNISYLSSETGSTIGTANVSGYGLKNNSVTGAITVERPEVNMTTGNDEFEAVLPAGTSAIYVSSNMNMISGVSYTYSNFNVLSDKLEQTYYTIIHLYDGQLSYATSSYYGSIPVYSSTYALVKASDFSTPTDTATPTDPSDDSATPTDPTPDITPDTPSTDDTTGDTAGDTTGDTVAGDVTPDHTTDAYVPNNTAGLNSVAQTVDESDIVPVEQVTEDLDNKLDSSPLAIVESTSKEVAPVLSSDIFSKMKETQKSVTVGVTDANDRLQYSWTFNSETLTDTDMNIDLSISFDTDRAEKVQSITGRDDVVYLSFAHHGTLPGPATIKTYVGDKYKNGDIVYLYYYNEELDRVETVGNGGLVVNSGYVEYTITHCSVYFLSEETADAINAVSPDDDSAGEMSTETITTGDTTNVMPYMVGAGASVIALAALLFVDKKKKRA